MSQNWIGPILVGMVFKNRKGDEGEIIEVRYKVKFKDGSTGLYGENLKLIDNKTNTEITVDDSSDLVERTSHFERRKA